MFLSSIMGCLSCSHAYCFVLSLFNRAVFVSVPRVHQRPLELSKPIFATTGIASGSRCFRCFVRHYTCKKGSLGSFGEGTAGLGRDPEPECPRNWFLFGRGPCRSKGFGIYTIRSFDTNFTIYIYIVLRSVVPRCDLSSLFGSPVLQWSCADGRCSHRPLAARERLGSG